MLFNTDALRVTLGQLAELGQGGFENVEVIPASRIQGQSSVDSQILPAAAFYDIFIVNFVNLQPDTDCNFLMRCANAANDFSNNPVHSCLVRSYRTGQATDLGENSVVNGNDFILNQTSGGALVGANTRFSGQVWCVHPAEPVSDIHFRVDTVYGSDTTSAGGIVNTRGTMRFDDTPCVQFRFALSAGAWDATNPNQRIIISGLQKVGSLNP